MNPLEEGLRGLEALARDRARRPDRYDARALLVPLGEALLSQKAHALSGVLERCREAAESLGEAWSRAVLDELSLAAAEHVHAIDERYLGLPNYDLAYTRAARQRLEARLVAAAELDIELPEALQQSVALADRRLERHLAERG